MMTRFQLLGAAIVVVAGVMTSSGGARAAPGQGGDEIVLTDLMVAAESVEERTLIRVSAGRLPDLYQPGRAEPTVHELMEATRPFFRPALQAIAERAAQRRQEKGVAKTRPE
jgi:hypothetical protein